MTTFWTLSRIRRISLAVLVGFALALFFSLFRPPQDRKLLTEGDFPAFYSAAVLLQQGNAESLYDPEKQRELQNQFWPELDGSYYYFVYPPYVALLAQPFALLPPVSAKLVTTVLMIFGYLAAVVLAGTMLPFVRSHRLVTAAVLLSILPVTIGVLGGQNIAISLLLYVGILYFYSKEGKAGQTACGLCLGLLFFKPHYAVFLLLFFLAARAYRVVCIALGVFAVYYGLSAFTAGLLWPLDWLEGLKFFTAQESFYNKQQMISIAGFLEAFASVVTGRDAGMEMVSRTGTAASLLLAGWLMFLFWKTSQMKTESNRKEALGRLLELAGPGIVLFSMHSMYYDFGLCLFAWFKYLKLDADTKISRLIAILAFIFLTTPIKDQLGIQPLFFVVLGIFIFVHRLWWHDFSGYVFGNENE